jgi:hypothetical protein
MGPKELQLIYRTRFVNVDHFNRNQQLKQLFGRYTLDDTCIGFSEIHVNRDIGSIEFNKFYPLSTVESGYGLKRRGIGTLAHALTLLELIATVPDVDSSFAVWHPPINLSKERKAMLASMGIDMHTRLGLYLETVITYANKKGFDLKNPLK